MRKLNVGILIFDDVELLDFAGPYEILSRTRTEGGIESRRSEEHAPFSVFTVAKSRQSVRATGGLGVIPDCSFDDAPSIDLVLIPGGFGTRRLLQDAPTLQWIKRTATKAQITASVCTGSLLLAKCGLLDGRRATTHWGALELLERIGPSLSVDAQSRYVDDGVITSAGVAAGIDMALYLVEKICGASVAEETAHYIDYPRRPSA